MAEFYDPQVAFHDLTDDEAKEAGANIADVALAEARLIASQRLIAGPAAGTTYDAHTVAAVLTARDQSDARYENLSYFEKPWALLVLRLISGVLADPREAVADARTRGVTVAEIAATLGITENGVYKRYGSSVVTRRRAPRR